MPNPDTQAVIDVLDSPTIAAAFAARYAPLGGATTWNPLGNLAPTVTISGDTTLAPWVTLGNIGPSISLVG